MHGEGRVARLAARVEGFSVRKHLAAAFVAGAISTLALPPVGLAPILFLTFPFLFLLLHATKTGRGAFFTGWAFGFGWFAISLYWISASLFVDISSFWWLLPFSATALPAGLAIYWALAARITHVIPRDRVLARITALAVTLSVAEFLRGHVLTGFPWNLPGYAWVDWSPVIQITSVIGIYGLTALTLLAALSPAALMVGRRAPFGCAVLVFALLTLWGAHRIGTGPHDEVANAHVRLVQPNIAQTLKWQPDQLRANFQRHLELAREQTGQVPNVVIWPETAVPFVIQDEPDVRNVMGWATPPGGITISGALGRDDEKRIYNSLLALDAKGDIVARFDKFHLVPFGEYVPLRRFIPLKGLAEVSGGDFGSGPGPRTIPLPGLPAASPLICYEVIFPDAAVDATARPGWLLNVTNDGWFGHTAGPHQHLAIARVRAVEQGLPLARAANTGISAMVDPYGRITASLPLGEMGVVDANLPAALNPTPYSHHGNTIFWAISVLLTACSLTGLRNRK
ncbi:apolipoprotein N-acyltransferase [Roseiterribacter gracilis]|uniref:Apolipoprotein N-acyltransferase n=1 Tax=Roseiterribacter gracilis TaxID=2812848 RepID=A0A8S8XD83_9PROT|nr:apolipoprotein N-acyltransferase [Rhodospirillales bacterium TMPK1]